MFDTPSSANIQPSCRTPVQGQDGFCNTSSAAISPSTLITSTDDDKTGSPSSPSTGQQTRRETALSTRQSAFGKSSVPADANRLRVEEGPLSNRVYPSTFDSAQKQQSRMTLTGDKSRDVLDASQQSRLGAWYMRRNNNKVASDLPREVRTASQESTPTKLQSSPGAAAATSPAINPVRTTPTSIPRFSFFNMASTLKGLTSSPVPVPKDDELINLDIDAALFPGGAPSDTETFSPAAFKNLHMNAVGILKKLQSAYQDKAIACQELRAERDAQEDGITEAETRTAHLKMQLEGMAQRANETEAMMQALITELNREKRLRAEEKSARESGIMSSGMSTISEDLGAEDDQKNKHRRRSGGTTKSDDAGFDTDDESVDEVSVFSRSRSPTISASISDIHVVENGNQGSIAPSPIPKSSMLEPPRPTRQSQAQMSAFQKLFKGISGDHGKDAERPGVRACQNCQGQDASVAWDTASLLRDENRGLKQRVGELECAVEEALDAVMGVRL